MTTLRHNPKTFSLCMLAGLLALCALQPSLVAAQAHTLRVSLHDADGRPVAGVSISLRDEAGHELARQTTSIESIATFVGLPPVVRVVIVGQARGGLILFQLGDDARGVRLDLSQAGEAPSLDLRVEHDGLVLPDPATMLTREEGGPVVSEASPFPTVALATHAPLPTAPAASDQPAVIVGEPVEAQPNSPGWVPWLTVLIIAFAAGAMLFIQRWRDIR